MQLANVQNCTECKVYPVRRNGRYLCYHCFEVALRDLLRAEDKRDADRVNQKS